jgi:hypothetical protein
MESLTTAVSDAVSSVYPSYTSVNTTATAPVFKEIELTDICFVSCIYGKNSKGTDKPGDFRNFHLNNATSHKFFLFTNLPDIDAPGWNKIVTDLEYRRFITQSRWGKFMAWKDPEIQQGCKTVFYFDGYFAPLANKTKEFLDMAAPIHASNAGLAQVNHPTKDRTALEEFGAILKSKKDIEKNVDKSIAWLNAQPDFHNNCTLYANWYFGFDPTNANFQKATQFFWDHYSKEKDSWQYQPLWCYSLDPFHLKPIPMNKLFEQQAARMGHKGRKYDKNSDNDASVAVKGKKFVAQ